MKNSLRKIMFGSSILTWIYLSIYVIYGITAIRFSKLLGLSFDIASGSMEGFKEFTIELILIMVAMLALYAIYSRIKLVSNKRIKRTVKKNLYSSIFNAPISVFKKQNHESYASMLINDTKLIETEYIEPTFSLIEEVVMLSLALVALVQMNWMCCLFVLVVSLLPIIVPGLFVSGLQRRMMVYASENTTFLNQTSNLMESIELYKNRNGSEVLELRFDNNNLILSKVKKDAYQFMDVLISSIAVSANMVLLGILVFGMVLALNNILSIGEVFAILFISGSIVAPLGSISQKMPQVMGCKEIITKYNETLNIKIKDKEDLTEEVELITMDNVSLELDEKLILNNISLRLEKNKKYAFVGSSGSGKSTVLKTILGYYEDYKGLVKYNEKSLHNISSESLYNQLTYVNQETQLFECTIRENLTMFNPNITDDQLIDATRFAEIDHKIDNLEEGYETLISESGGNLSGGEKQRISIARAILKNSPIYMLDEATSALDHENYLRIEQKLLNRKNTTLITVTHRIEEAILGKYDKVFVFHEGKCKEQGTFEELITEKGQFYKLYNSQK